MKLYIRSGNWCKVKLLNLNNPIWCDLRKMWFKRVIYCFWWNMLYIKYCITWILNNLFAKLCVFIMWNTCISELIFEAVCASTNLLSQASEIWGDWNEAQAHIIIVCERILNHLAKLGILAIWLSLPLRTERLLIWFWFSMISSSYGLRYCFFHVFS